MITTNRKSTKKYHHNKKDPCPVCGGLRCSQFDDKLFCLRVDGLKGEIINGWKCIAPLKNLVSTWVPMGESIEKTYSPKTSSKIEYPKSDRHFHNCQVLDNLTLSDNHRQQLLDRGYKPEDLTNYRSVEAGQHVSVDFPKNFPTGFDNKLAVWGEGILIPIFDYRKLLIGFQVRLDNPDGGGRYRCVSHSQASFTIDGELPLAFYSRENFDTIDVVESPLKSHLAFCLHDLPAVAGMISYAPRQLLAICDYHKVNKVIVNPDAGDIKNPQVMNKWDRLNRELKRHNITVLFRWWGQLTKQDSDIDELNSLENSKLLTPLQFFNLATPKTDLSPKFTPTITLNQITIPDENCHIKAAMGSGKTQKLLEKIKKWEQDGHRVILVGHRNTLLKQTISRASELGVVIYHLHDDNAIALARDPYTHIACCIDSLHHLVDVIDGKTIVVIDEIVGVLDHIRSNTLSYPLICNLHDALNRCGIYITLDANHSDLVANTVDGISSKISTKILVDIPVNKFPVTFIEGRGTLKQDIKHGKKILVVTDSIKQAKKTSLLASKWGIDQGEILVVSSETNTLETTQRFVENPDQFLGNNDYKLVILTPTCESGISIQLPYFDLVYGIFTGVAAVTQLHQMLSRYRLNVPRYIDCKVVGVKAKNFDRFDQYQDCIKQKQQLIESSIDALSYTNYAKILGNTNVAYTFYESYYHVASYNHAVASTNYRNNTVEYFRILGFEVNLLDTDDNEIKEEVKTYTVEWELNESQKLKGAIAYDNVGEALSIKSPTENQNFRIEKTLFEASNPGLIDSCNEADIASIRKNKPAVKAVNRFVDVLNLSTPPMIAIPVDMGEGASKLDLVNNKNQDILKRVTYDLLPYIVAVIKLDNYKYDTHEVERLLCESSKYHGLLNINKKLKTIQIVNDLLKLVGYTSAMVKQVREGKNRYRVYRAIAHFGEGLNEKIVNSRKLSQAYIQQPVDTVTPPLSLYIKNEPGVTTLPEGLNLPTGSTLPEGLNDKILNSRKLSQAYIQQAVDTVTPPPTVYIKNDGGVTTLPEGLNLPYGITVKIETGFEKHFKRVSYGNFEQIHVDLRVALRLLYEKIQHFTGIELLKLPTGENLIAYALHS
jgi:hypothetical protein